MLLSLLAYLHCNPGHCGLFAAHDNYTCHHWTDAKKIAQNKKEPQSNEKQTLQQQQQHIVYEVQNSFSDVIYEH